MSLRYVKEVTLRGGKQFRVGQEVEAAPGRKKEMKDYLGGAGPYKVAQIGIWPCGGVNLYFSDLENGRSGAGAQARDFFPAD